MFSFLSHFNTSRKVTTSKQCRLNLEAFESRDMLSAVPVFVPAAHELRIVGTVRNDVVEVHAASERLIVNSAGRSFSFAARGIDRVTFAGLQGNDTFINNTAVRSTLDGGAGDDILRGGSGNDILRGGAGRDDLMGGRGDDRLDGGTGDDHVNGGLGNDVVFGGQGNDTARRDRLDRVTGVEQLEYHAVLTGVAGASGVAEFKPGSSERHNFEVTVAGLTAGQTFDVYLDGQSVGQIRIGSLGRGKLETSNATLPVSQGSILSIRNSLGEVLLSGSFTNTESGDDHGGSGGSDDAGDDHGSGHH